MKLVERQIKETETLMDETINAIALRHKAQGELEEKPSDIEILQCLFQA